MNILRSKRGFPFINTNEAIENETKLQPDETLDEKFIEEYNDFLINPKADEILLFLKKLQMKTSERVFPLEKFRDNDNFMIKFLIHLLLKEDFPLIQYYTCWILSSLLANEESNSFERIIYDNGGLNNLLKLISYYKGNSSNDSIDLYNQILWVIGNFFGSDNIPFEEINSQLFSLCKIIIVNLNKENENMSFWTLGNILKGKIPVKEIEFNELLIFLLDLLYKNEDENNCLEIYSIIAKYIGNLFSNQSYNVIKDEYKSTLEIAMRFENNKFFYFMMEKYKILSYNTYIHT